MLLVHELLKRSFQDHPDKEAVVCAQRRFFYRDIENLSDMLANFLISKGVKYGDRIGIFSNKEIEEIIAIFAILKVGGIFVHINPQFKENQLAHVISDCDIKVLFLNDSKAFIFKKSYPQESPLNLIIHLSPNRNKSSISNSEYYIDGILKESSNIKIICKEIKENDIASIVYTSGSTGMPKGIIITHKIFYDSTVISASILENNINDRLISVTPFSFDGALSQLFTSFLVGGTIILQPSNFPADIVKTLLNERITGMHAVPSLWIMMLQRHSPFRKFSYPHLRYISIIGEVFPRPYLITIKKILSHTKFYIMYGTTEAFRSTYLPPEVFDRKIPSVGKPFPGVEISIVDESDRICKAGEVGEIVHKGVFVSPGYWNTPMNKLDPFRKDSLYTGDLGKIDEEGYLYFVGRKDGMIKTNGYRVSPEEIEECLHKINKITEVAVIGVPDELIGNKIKAIIVTRDGHVLTSRDVADHCKSQLPNYMVPGIIEFRGNLPKTSTNKINKSELS